MPTKKARVVCMNPKCEQKGKPQMESNFYKSNKFGMVVYPVCKDCLKKQIDVNDTQTVIPILQDMNIAFVKDVWDSCMTAAGGSDATFGLYMSRISKSGLPAYDKSVFHMVDEDTGEVIEDEDSGKLIYSKEWNGKFSQRDIDYLNNYYNGLLADYDIKTTNHKDYAKKIAKASLAMDREFEKVLNGEPDTVYKNLRDTFDKLSNSAKFSESQRSANDVGLGSFGLIAARVEKNEWIPEYEPVDKDTYDLIIEQFSNIEKSL